MDIELHHNDLPDGLELGASIAVDTETTGLSLGRDRLCLIQLSPGEGVAHLVKFDLGAEKPYAAPNLRALLGEPAVLKIMHYARFDIAVIHRDLGALAVPVYCTKIASRLVRTYTDRHGLKDLCRELLGIDLSKQQQSSDWAAAELSHQQLEYAASDVVFLHDLKTRLDTMLARHGRTELANSCFDFLATRTALDLAGWEDEDIFAHS